MSKATHRLRWHSSFLLSEFSHCESDRNESRETACHTSENHETTMQRTDCGLCRLSMLTCDGRQEETLARAKNWLASRADCAIPFVGHLRTLHQRPGSRLSDTPARCFSPPRTCKRRSRPPPVAVQVGFAE